MKSIKITNNTLPLKTIDDVNSPHPNNRASNISTTVNTTTSVYYEPTSVLDPHLTSSPAVPYSHPPPSSTAADWDPLTFFLSSSNDHDNNNHNNMDDHDPFDFIPDDDEDDDEQLPSSNSIPGQQVQVQVQLQQQQQQQQQSSSFDRNHLDLLLKAASAVESNDVSTAYLILSRLSHSLLPLTPSSSPLHRSASHFIDALLSLLPIPDPPTATPSPLSPLLILNRITSLKSFSDLSPIPQFTSFTANQTILESLTTTHHHLPFNNNNNTIHIIDFDIGLGGQWSSFLQELASRTSSLRSPPPTLRITAVVPEESLETLLAADNLRDFARSLGISLSLSFVHVASLGALALSRARLSPADAVAVVITPAIFRHVGGAHESAAAVLRFVRQASPRVVVFADAEGFASSGSFRRSFAAGLEHCAAVGESMEAAAAARGEDGEAVRRVEEAVVRPRVFSSVAGWVPREATWREVMEGGGFTPVGFSDFTESQAEWLLRRAPVEGFHVARREGALMLSWKGRELASTSAWRC